MFFKCFSNFHWCAPKNPKDATFAAANKLRSSHTISGDRRDGDGVRRHDPLHIIPMMDKYEDMNDDMMIIYVFLMTIDDSVWQCMTIHVYIKNYKDILSWDRGLLSDLNWTLFRLPPTADGGRSHCPQGPHSHIHSRHSHKSMETRCV